MQVITIALAGTHQLYQYGNNDDEKDDEEQQIIMVNNMK